MVVSVSHSGFWDPKRFFTKLSFFWWFFVFSVVGLVWWIGLSCRCGLLGCILRGAVLSCVRVIFSCSGSFFSFVSLWFGVVSLWCFFFVLVFRGGFFGVGFPVLLWCLLVAFFSVEILCCGAGCVLL